MTQLVVVPVPFRITDRFGVEEVIAVGGELNVRLLWPLEYRVGHADSDEVMLAPKGFLSDGCSTPELLRGFVPQYGLHARPVFFHDLGYKCKGDLPNLLDYLQDPAKPWGPMLTNDEVTAYLNLKAARPEINARRYTRPEIDRIALQEINQVVGVSAWRRTVMYRAVRMGGGGGWGR